MHGVRVRSSVPWPRKIVACQVLQVASARRTTKARDYGLHYQQERAPGSEQVLQPPQQQSHSSTQQHGLATVGTAALQLPHFSQHGHLSDASSRPTTGFRQPQPLAGGAADISCTMSPGALTAAFVELLKQHTRLNRAEYSPLADVGDTSADRPGADDVLQQPGPQHMQEQEQQHQHQHVEQLLQYAAQLTPQLQPHQASLILYVCAKCQLPLKEPLLQALLLQLQPHQLQQLPPAGLVNTVWALAVLSFHPSPDWLDAFFAASGRTTTDTVTTNSSSSSSMFAAYNPHQQVQLLWAAGSLPQRPPAAWVQGLLATLQPHLKTLSPTELTNTIWGLSRIGFRPGRDWLGYWFLASRQALPRNSLDCLASQVASLGVLRVELKSGRWLISMRACVLQQLHAMQPQHIAAILCGLAKRRSPTPPHWLEAVLHHQIQLLSNSSNSSNSRSRSRSRRNSNSDGPRHQCRDVAATVWSLPLLLHPTAVNWATQAPNAALLRQLVSLSLPLLPECTVGELVQLAAGFAGLGYYPGAHWLKSHENAVAQHKLALTDVNRWRLRAAVRRLWQDG